MYKMDNLKVINLNQQLPKVEFKISKKGKFISYGVDNLYPNFLLDLYNNKSNKHQAIINRKVDMTTGSGFQEVETTQAKNFLKNAHNSQNRNMDYIAKKANYDYEIFNGMSLMLRWNMEGTKITAVEWIPFHKCRLSVDEKYVMVSSDWSKGAKAEYETYLRFNDNTVFDKDNTNQILYYVEETVGYDYYTIPYYSASIDWFLIDDEISRYHLSSIQNGFSAGYFLTLPEQSPDVSEDEAEENDKRIRKSFTGSNNAGKVVIAYVSKDGLPPTLTEIKPNGSDERFVLLQNQVLTEILIGHSVTSPLLFGIRTEGQLGGRNELLESLAIFQSTYINNRQKTIENIFSKIASYSGVTESLRLNKYTIDFSSIENNNI